MEKATVSVFMVTYNHEKFIEQAIRSVVTQQTDFSFELIISDDCSTDSTPEIIRRWHRKYPHIIKPLFNAVNVGAQRNFAKIIKVCSGRYTAIIDGDDYWTAPDKLQKQFDFLETNSECAICFHQVKVVYEDGSRPPYTMPSNHSYSERLTIDDLFRGYFMATSSVFFRTGLFTEWPEWYDQLPFGDRPLHLLNCHYGGEIGYLNEQMSVYRLHNDGIWSLKHQEQATYYLERKIYMLQHFDSYTKYKYKNEIAESIGRYKVQLMIEQMKGDNFKPYKWFPEWKSIRHTDLKLFRIVLFGTGTFGTDMLLLFRKLNIPVSYCLDNDSNKWEKTFCGITIYPPSKLAEESKDQLIILVASMYYKEIGQQLSEMGFEENKHYYEALNLNAYIDRLQ